MAALINAVTKSIFNLGTCECANTDHEYALVVNPCPRGQKGGKKICGGEEAREMTRAGDSCFLLFNRSSFKRGEPRQCG